MRLILFVVLVIALLILYAKLKDFLTGGITITAPESLSALLPDETMGYSRFDFSNAILGKSREKSEFVVLEQDVSVTSRVSQALANLALFEKSQLIRSYGTGVYSVDLSKLTEDDVALDNELKTVTVTIPHAALSYLTVDVDKAEYEETQKAIFAFGEIKLTNEQMGLLEQSIQDAMRTELETADMLAKADASAIAQVQKLFLPLVQAVAADYTVVILLADS
ncbi:hypothetical protein SDC9_107338 [bioreactor metagenome]|uniref:DUF4230 domain-containing protein n=1 Tax=bioreactor metagenome TaxID=1076179 RepID=A0A645B516_9ZZZZ